jgi:hypothetical protein
MRSNWLDRHRPPVRSSRRSSAELIRPHGAIEDTFRRHMLIRDATYSASRAPPEHTNASPAGRRQGRGFDRSSATT